MIDKLYPLIRRKTMPEGLMRNPYPPPCNAREYTSVFEKETPHPR